MKSKLRMRRLRVSSARPGPAICGHQLSRALRGEHTRRCAEMPPRAQTTGAPLGPTRRQATAPGKAPLRDAGRSCPVSAGCLREATPWDARAKRRRTVARRWRGARLGRSLQCSAEVSAHRFSCQSTRGSGGFVASIFPRLLRREATPTAHLPARHAAGRRSWHLSELVRPAVAPASKGLFPQPVSMSGGKSRRRPAQRQGSWAAVCAKQADRRPPLVLMY